VSTIVAQLAGGFAVFALAMLLEAGATIGVLEWRRHHMRALRARYNAARGMAHVVGILLFLLLVHLLQMLVWAVVYYNGGAFSSFYVALFFSMSTFSTLGFANFLPPPNWELFAALEGVAGSLLMGWSAGVLFAAAHAFYRSLLAERASLEPGLD
jgi:hypothetical protein